VFSHYSGLPLYSPRTDFWRETARRLGAVLVSSTRVGRPTYLTLSPAGFWCRAQLHHSPPRNSESWIPAHQCLHPPGENNPLLPDLDGTVCVHHCGSNQRAHAFTGIGEFIPVPADVEGVFEPSGTTRFPWVIETQKEEEPHRWNTCCRYVPQPFHLIPPWTFPGSGLMATGRGDVH